MFKSSEDIEQRFEVFLFMCGIMEDPSSAINHLCEQYVNDFKREQNFEYRLDEDYFIKVSKEIRNKKKFLNPFYNEQFYHVWQLPLKRQSRFYYFGKNLDWLEIAGNENASHTVCRDGTRIHNCDVVIVDTCLPHHDVLQAILSLRQTITGLFISYPFMVSDEVWKNNPAHVFKIDPLARQIYISRNVVLPTNVSKSLGQEISKCYNLKELRIQNNFSIAVEIADWLGVNTKITDLDFDFCNLSREKSEKLCQQIKHLSSLKWCSLSGNVLGDAVSVLAESILSWGTNNSLKGLNLRNCSITSQGCTRLLEGLGVCPNLKRLDLSHNTIGGTFNGLKSKSIFPQLCNLLLYETALSAGDIKVIRSLIAEHRLPKMLWIPLSCINLDILELDTLETLESLNYIIRNEENVYFLSPT